MKGESTIKPTVALPNSAPAPQAGTSPNVKDHVSSSSEVKSTGATLRKLPITPATSQQPQIPVRIETPLSALPEDSVHAIIMETPPDSEHKTVKRRHKPRTPTVARLLSNRQWEPYWYHIFCHRYMRV